MFGFLNVYKPQGKTSHDVVNILRRVTGVRQIGHTGTLDPFAEGVLPICIGKATRLIEYLSDDKAYVGVIQLGKATTTYDIEGECTKESSQKVDLDCIKKNITKFLGEIEQFPPIYSAIKVKGKKLYEYARNGESVDIQSRKVTIYKLEILEFDYEKQILKVYIECSKGTYIRSIANDLGQELGVYGYLAKLIRVKAGDFLLENSIKLDDLNDLSAVKRNLLSPLSYLSFPKYQLSDKEQEKVLHGNPIMIDITDGCVVLTISDKIAAIADVKEKKARIVKVFL